MNDKLVEAILKEEQSLRQQSYDLRTKALELANLANNVASGDYTDEALEELAERYNVVQQSSPKQPARSAKKQTEDVQKDT